MKPKLTKEQKIQAKQQKKLERREFEQKEKQRKLDLKIQLKSAKTKQERREIKKKARLLAPKMKKTTLINIISVCMVGVISGLAVGLYFGPTYVDPNRYNYDVSILKDDVAEIRKEAQTKTPEQLGATKCCVLAFDNTFNSPKVRVDGVGYVKAMGVKQTINALTIRVDNQMFYENVSISSVVKAMNRYYVNGDEIKHHGGSINGNYVEWNIQHDNTSEDSIKTMTDYKAQYGSTMNEYMTYIVSSKTVVRASEVTVNDDGNYVFSLTLDKTKSVVNYVKNMKATGGLSGYPDFTHNPEISIVMDSNFRILTFTSYEKYTVSIGISAKSEGTLTNTFSYDEDFEIPEITTNTRI